nr:MAG TPA: hypothetical protein [Caudoviricetes sp.]
MRHHRCHSAFPLAEFRVGADQQLQSVARGIVWLRSKSSSLSYPR